MATRPNVLFVFADQMRAQAMAHAGDRNAITPNFDRFAQQATRFENAVSGCPVCCPARASLITGQYPHEHGVFLNDVTLGDDATSIAQAFKAGGYHTGYIGKWHLYGKERGGFVPRDGRQGFEHWQARQCTHQYWDAFYYEDTPEKKTWQGYDAFAQTEQACEYLKDRADDGQPFLLMLSWGPPHDPYMTAPEKYQKLFDPDKLVLRDNVPAEHEAKARQTLAGYYAHIAALDDAFGRLMAHLQRVGLEKDTLVVFWSDHGDMVGSRGQWNKQRPWDESIRVPLLIRGVQDTASPQGQVPAGQSLDQPINTPDLMPTLLELAGLAIPPSVRGSSYASYIRTGQKADAPADAALIACYWAFAQYSSQQGGREFRGVRTDRYTYVITHDGPWLLYDNQADPYQLSNLVDQPEHAALQRELAGKLEVAMREQGDDFTPGREMLTQWGYTDLDTHGAVKYIN